MWNGHDIERLARKQAFADCGRAPGICFTGRIRGSTSSLSQAASAKIGTR
jgi:hypothetical protein